jgi:flagellar export protein FliJ
MSDFKFRLATLLRLRETTRNERREELADSQRAEAALRQQADQLQAEWDHLVSMTRQAACPGAVDIGRLIEIHRYQQTVESQRRQLDEQLTAKTAEVGRRREALMEADRDVRTLEKLRDSQQMRHHLESHREEIKRIDEATQLRGFVQMDLPTVNLVGSEYHG